MDRLRYLDDEILHKEAEDKINSKDLQFLKQVRENLQRDYESERLEVKKGA
jgi:hypothetical protein